MKTRTTAALVIGAAAAVALFVTVALVVYRMRPTPGTVILVVGWMSILAAGYFMVRTVGALGEGPMALEEVTDDRRDELEREKKNLLKAIKEAEFDRDTGKMDGGEAQAAIERYRAKAVEILRLLDEDPARRYESVIEKEVARRLSSDAAPGCAACGSVNDEDAAFCKKCGAKLGASS